MKGLFYGIDEGAETFFAYHMKGRRLFCLSNDGAGTFFEKIIDGAETFSEERKIDGVGTFSEKTSLLEKGLADSTKETK